MPSELPQLIPVFPGGTPLLPPVVGSSIPVSSPLPPASFGLVMDPSRKLAASVLDALDSPGPTLDPLDLLPYSEARLDALDSFGSARGSLDKPDSFLGETLMATFSLFSLDSAASSLISEALHLHSTCSHAHHSPGQYILCLALLELEPWAGCLPLDQTVELAVNDPIWCSAGLPEPWTSRLRFHGDYPDSRP